MQNTQHLEKRVEPFDLLAIHSTAFKVGGNN